MALMTIVVDVPDADPLREDPQEVAEEILDDADHYEVRTHRMVYAEWGETLRGNPSPGRRP